MPDEESPISELVHETWHRGVSRWLDYRLYFAQRRRILANPVVVLMDDFPGLGEKSALKFASQGALTTVALLWAIALFVGVVDRLLPDSKDPLTDLFISMQRYKRPMERPEELIKQLPGWVENSPTSESRDYAAKVLASDYTDEEVREEVEYVREEIDDPEKLAERVAAFNGELLKEPSKDPMTGVMNLELANLGWRRDLDVKAILLLNRVNYYIEFERQKRKALTFLNSVVGPFSPLLPAYVFAFLLTRSIGRVAQNTAQAPNVYLYIVTARIFWVNLSFFVAGYLLTMLIYVLPMWPTFVVVASTDIFCHSVWLWIVLRRASVDLGHIFRIPGLGEGWGPISADISRVFRVPIDLSAYVHRRLAKKIRMIVLISGVIVFVVPSVLEPLLASLYARSVTWFYLTRA